MPDDFVIWSFEHQAWWRPGSWGYTHSLTEAGHYTEAEARDIVRHANLVAVHERAMSYDEAIKDGPPVHPHDR